MKYLIFCLLLLASQPATALRFMYVDDFADILENSSLSTALLQYAQSHSVDALMLYELHLVHNNHNLAQASTNQILADFISNAKVNYGVDEVCATGETGAFFQNVIQAYNDSRSNSSEKFDVYGLEFEFWTPTFTEPGGYYCVNYLAPNGLSCDTDGAFTFCLQQLQTMNTLAATNAPHLVKTEMYIGWPSAAQTLQIAALVNRLLIHAYVSSPSSAFTYALTRLDDFNSASGVTDVSIIFSAETSFMGGWLQSNSMLAAEQIFNTDYNAASGDWKAHVNLLGYSYFTYMMLGNVALPIEWIDFTGKATPCCHILEWKLEGSDRETLRVQRSADTFDWQPVSPPLDMASGQWADEHPLPGFNYYRLAAIAPDGAIDYSPVLVLQKQAEQQEIQLFPNPASLGQAWVRFQFPLEVESLQCRLVGASGIAFETTCAKDGEGWRLDLPPGIGKGQWLLLAEGDGLRLSKILQFF